MSGLSSLRGIQDLVDVNINNDFNDSSELDAYLENLNLLDPQHLRPSWDAYFMVKNCCDQILSLLTRIRHWHRWHLDDLTV